MSKRKKYDFDFRKSVVDKVIKERKSSERVSQELGLTESMVKRWVSFYKKYGLEGIKPIRNKYTPDFKIQVILEMRKKRLSLSQTCIQFKIPSWETLSKWIKIYHDLGPAGLRVEKRGRSKSMPRKTKKIMTKEEQLLDELASLRAENDYLKKLHALIQSEKKKEGKRLSSRN